MSWEISIYATAQGNAPVREFLAKLSDKQRMKVSRYISLLAEYGDFISPPYAKKLHSNLYELRVTGTVQIRVFYTKKLEQFILLHAFVKKTQKTPKKDIRIAIDRMKTII